MASELDLTAQKKPTEVVDSGLSFCYWQAIRLAFVKIF
jgi:hypothetical protein